MYFCPALNINAYCIILGNILYYTFLKVYLTIKAIGKMKIRQTIVSL